MCVRRSPHSRRAYATSLRDFFAACQMAPGDVTKKDIIAYRDELRLQAYSPATINRHLAAIRVLYQAALDEGLIGRNPAAGVKTLETSAEGTTPALSGDEVRSLLDTIDRTSLPGLRDYALILLLVGTGLRREEAARLQIADLAQHLGHWTLRITRKGGKVAVIPLAPRTARAIDLAVGERIEGPIFARASGERLDRHSAGRIVRRVVRRAGITKQVGPHTLRHAFITAALDAGVPLRDVQEAASHADPRTTMRYDRARVSLDRHATYIVSAFVAGAAR